MHPAVFFLLFMTPCAQTLPVSKTATQMRFGYAIVLPGLPPVPVVFTPWVVDHTKAE